MIVKTVKPYYSGNRGNENPSVECKSTGGCFFRQMFCLNSVVPVQAPFFQKRIDIRIGVYRFIFGKYGIFKYKPVYKINNMHCIIRKTKTLERILWKRECIYQRKNFPISYSEASVRSQFVHNFPSSASAELTPVSGTLQQTFLQGTTKNTNTKLNDTLQMKAQRSADLVPLNITPAFQAGRR